MPTNFKNINYSYPSVNKSDMYSHCENLWEYNSGSNLGLHTTVDYGASADEDVKQGIVSHNCLGFNILSLWNRNSLTTNMKCKLGLFKNTTPSIFKITGTQFFCY